MLDDARIRALVATAAFGSPARIRDALLEPGAVETAWAEYSHEAVAEVVDRARILAERHVNVLLPADLPARLMVRGRPVVPYLMARGNRAVIDRPALAVSGSRGATDEALRAARAVGALAAALQLSLVVGNARGVDTAAAEGARSAGGDLITVLPEGILRAKTASNPDGDGDHLVVSQFAPDARWSSFNAMARNRTICALGAAVVVVQAGEKGGSLDAGFKALSLRRPLFVLSYRSGMPPGNAILIDKGGIAIEHIRDLRSALEELGAHPDTPEQTTLL